MTLDKPRLLVYRQGDSYVSAAALQHTANLQAETALAALSLKVDWKNTPNLNGWGKSPLQFMNNIPRENTPLAGMGKGHS